MDNGARERRARCFLSVIAVLFGILVFRLYLLQIANWEQYRIQSEKNTMQPVSIEASRGLIRDRNGVILVENRPSYSVSVIPPRLLRNTDQATRTRVISRLSKIVGLQEDVIRQKLLSRKRHFYEPVKLKRDVGFRTVSIIEESRYDLPGVEIQVEARRGYPAFNGPFPLAPHVLGYVGLIDPDLYPQMGPLGYRLDDQIGKRGVERLCESSLRGKDGVEYIEVNAWGREVGGFPDKTEPPEPGGDISLTVDWRIQLTAEQALRDTLKGSVVAMDPRDGAILAMASRPGFHPRSVRNLKEWQSLQADPEKPLLNRSIQGEYPAGSILKMVTAVAALEMGVIKPREIRYPPCEGELAVGDRVFRCYHQAGHGELDLRHALIHSCDVFFYHLGRDVGIANWSRYAKILGFSHPTGIDIAAGGDGEAKGLVTDRAYYKKYRGKWVEGFMLNLSIGQGETTVTPIQVARYVSALAVGSLPRPFILNGTKSHPPGEPVAISTQTLEETRSILRDVVGVPYGTGRAAHIEGIEVAGKTGTAQNSHGDDHAWFVAFAPAEEPEIVVVVLAENAGKGGEVAAPIARTVLQTYFQTDAPDWDPPPRVAADLSRGGDALASGGTLPGAAQVRESTPPLEGMAQ
ncbi:MAG: penicillin-binding protein 2 [Candidatus Latescibacteria bacterium]|nr:penicillin-binding protein 2 [Candidatus Latescibacterota bacterium]